MKGSENQTSKVYFYIFSSQLLDKVYLALCLNPPAKTDALSGSYTFGKDQFPKDVNNERSSVGADQPTVTM